MELLELIDSKDYKDEEDRIIRQAVGGIIQKNGKAALTPSKYGDYKFPGGGMEAGEADRQTKPRMK